MGKIKKKGELFIWLENASFEVIFRVYEHLIKIIHHSLATYLYTDLAATY